MKHRRRKNFLRALILGFAVAAFAASTAQASYHTQKAQEARSALNQTYTPQALKALALRSEAMNQQYRSAADSGLEIRSEAVNKLSQLEAVRPDDRSGIRGVEPSVVGSDLSEIQRHVRADEIGSQSVSTRPDDKAGMRGPGIVQAPEVVAASGDGFNWQDAGIGAGTAAGIALLLMSGIVVSRRRQSGLAV